MGPSENSSWAFLGKQNWRWPSPLSPLPLPSVCPSKKPPCVDSKRPRVYRHHAHMCYHMCAWCRYTRGRFESTHGGFFCVPSRATHHTTFHTHTRQHHNTQHHTETERHRDREKQRERQRKKTETERDRERDRERDTRQEKTRQDKTRKEKTRQ